MVLASPTRWLACKAPVDLWERMVLVGPWDLKALRVSRVLRGLRECRGLPVILGLKVPRGTWGLRASKAPPG